MPYIEFRLQQEAAALRHLLAIEAGALADGGGERGQMRIVQLRTLARA